MGPDSNAVRDSRGQEPRRPFFRGRSAVWKLAVGVLAFWVMIRVLAGLLLLFGFVVLALAVPVGVYLFVRSRKR